jgi:hypothetical protein
MNPFTAIFFNIMTFCAGGMCFINLAHLVNDAGVGYDYAWWKVAAFLVLGMAFSLMSHSEHHTKHHYYKHER